MISTAGPVNSWQKHSIRLAKYITRTPLSLSQTTIYIAEGFGIKVEHHTDSTPTLKTPIVHELSDVDRLKVPNPLTDGRRPVYLQAEDFLASIDMISPSMYEQWAYPYEKIFFQEINPYAKIRE